MEDRFGKSEKSLMTFAPQKSNHDDFNLKINEVEIKQSDLRPTIGPNVTKRIYSKEDFSHYSSLKSVIKPRMIYMLKEGRENKDEVASRRDPDSEKDSDDESHKEEEKSSEPSLPFSSDSESVYEHA